MPKPTKSKQPLLNLDSPSCDSREVHLDSVRQVQPEIIPTEKAQRMADFFGTLADPHRLRLLSALAKQELCVCDLAASVKMSESAVSHQLRILRTMRLVKYRREGRNVYYSLADNHVINIYHEVATHIDEPQV
ncbi:metalloregulator ArsR/SmtB family transcription factor [Rivularia sp. UHCC 0363]|uniref:ArsR/SmtB family transcription factor n=1 Tax=Rivularia sp. UHCC 0363 TaxID=3110244 RepID=UPI002B1FDE26|nr:metalloregulator ArsR/SmtB family transcription factor [Rivularia sp. UHCC 0363]MEA5595485.1 metalloregulator ArsR/SmtB family transcription factor [Rivularia sp. UHCC 0363]